MIKNGVLPKNKSISRQELAQLHNAKYTFDQMGERIGESRQYFYNIRKGHFEVKVKHLYGLSELFNFNFFVWLAGEENIAEEIEANPARFKTVSPTEHHKVVAERDQYKEEAKEAKKQFAQLLTIAADKKWVNGL